MADRNCCRRALLLRDAAFAQAQRALDAVAQLAPEAGVARRRACLARRAASAIRRRPRQASRRTDQRDRAAPRQARRAAASAGAPPSPAEPSAAPAPAPSGDWPRAAARRFMPAACWPASADSRRRARSRPVRALTGASASRRRLTCTSTVRSSMKTWSPQTRSSNWARLCTRSGCVIRKCSRRNSVGPTLTSRSCAVDARVTRRVAGSSLQARHLDRLVQRLRRLAAQHRADARQQFLRRKGLGQVVVGAAIQAGQLVALFGARGQHDDRQRAWCAPRRATPWPAPGRTGRAASSRAAPGRAARGRRSALALSASAATVTS